MPAKKVQPGDRFVYTPAGDATLARHGLTSGTTVEVREVVAADVPGAGSADMDCVVVEWDDAGGRRAIAVDVAEFGQLFTGED